MTQSLEAELKIEPGDSLADPVPLVVDLDGTLLRSDLSFESALRLIKQRPWLALLIPFWLLKGRAFLKRRISKLITIDASLLPVNEDLLAWLKKEKTRGRRLILATASDCDQARPVVEPLAIFDAVIGSDGRRNLKGRNKLQTLVKAYGDQFDYVGNSRADLEIWRGCRYAILVNTTKRVQDSARQAARVTKVFTAPLGGTGNLIRAMRCYQWVKNLLVFIPTITSHSIFNGAIAAKAALAFLSFGFCASAAYIANDLLDLEEDRRHVRKRQRPLASGRMSLGSGLLLALSCLLIGAAIALFVTKTFAAALAAYIALTCLYSVFLKRLLVIDVLVLALLYTLRVVAGHLATGIPFSFWLLSFAFFLFLSLAFAKRVADLIQHAHEGQTTVPGRGYVTADLDALSVAGLCSGFLASLVLALYINSESVQLLYSHPAILWGLQPILLYYVTHLWVICRRGELTDDPIQYTATARSTYGAAILAILVLFAATFDFGSFLP